ncbi:MAG: type II toxin-antitoxin system Phd/YefM family antitoxin [Oribacterium sp.]|nr:type II toxin-antitoxin system Phd/YefM family antitoxin [Oribacterium sp.]MDY6308406.1 type II toxin-antitoxin system Phd/YefM family antitoxin [Oribacterium sp.]MDY6317110.1 type II toxin-antitoxin system Phd/YefM family antitoxin [Oribacterium sp.]
MPQIIPIKDLKDTSKISDMCHESLEPIYVTKNGYGDMVVMSMEAYEEMNHKKYIYDELALAEEDIKAGRTRDAFESLHEMRKKYGI